MNTLVLVVCTLIPQILAGVFITNPVAGTTGQGGKPFTISWKDDGSSPSLAEISNCDVGIYAGNSQQQTQLQAINASVDVSRQNFLNFTVDPKIGPNSDKYFIRMTSHALKDATNSQSPYEAFSSKFTLMNMSGQFSAAVQSQINAVTSGSSGPTSAFPPYSTAGPVTGNLISTTTSGSKPTTSTSSSSTPRTTSSSGALTTYGKSGSLGAISVAVALFGLY